MQLSKRLKAVADSVTRGNRVADVGCDHAYISIYLVENKISPQVIALDVNRGPLEKARENIRRYGYEAAIQTRLSDGLHEMKPKEADTILIAGMGGALMTKILTEGLEAVKQSRELVLQPQSELFLVRRFLHSIGFEIHSETMLMDEGKYYVIMKARPCNTQQIYEKEVFYLYGKLLLEQAEPVFFDYLNREKELRNRVMESLRQNPTENARDRMKEIDQELRYIEESLTYDENKI